MKHLMRPVLIVPLLAGVLFAQDPPKPQDDPKIQLNQITLQQFTESVARRTKKSIMLSDQASKEFATMRVRMYSFREYGTPEELFAVYQSVLHVHGYAIIPAGEAGKEVYKIMPLVLSLRGGGAPYKSDTTEVNDSLVTRVFSMQYVTAQDALTAIISIAPAQAVVPIPSAGMVVITDTDNNMRRYEEVIKAIDVKKPDIATRLVPLKKALATDLEQMMLALFSGVGGVGRPRQPIPGIPTGMEQVKVVADKRTNSVLIVAEPSRIDQVVSLIQQLDGEQEFETSGMYIIPLKHRDAKEMAGLLNSMYRIAVSDTTGAPTATTGGTKPNQPVGPAPSTPSPGSFGTSGQAAFGTEPTIVPDPASNSIIVVTDRATYQMLLRTTERLDRRRPQVLIKASVIEVRATDTFDFGFELARAVDPEGRITTFGRSNMGYSTLFPSGNTVNIVPADTAGLTLALIKDRFGNIGAMLKALKDKANISIIDEPEVATLDNGQAEITLKNTVQIPRTVISNNATETSFDALDADTTLKITPHISEGGYLRLDTEINISKFTFTSADPRVPPAVSSRFVKTPILVADGRTVVIGGIVTSDRTDARTSIPVLGDIPIFGVLFSRTREVDERRTLYIFITPYILADEAGGDWKNLSEDRKFNLINNGVHPDSVDHLQMKAKGDPIPWSSFRFVRPKEDN